MDGDTFRSHVINDVFMYSPLHKSTLQIPYMVITGELHTFSLTYIVVLTYATVLEVNKRVDRSHFYYRIPCRLLLIML